MESLQKKTIDIPKEVIEFIKITYNANILSMESDIDKLNYLYIIKKLYQEKNPKNIISKDKECSKDDIANKINLFFNQINFNYLFRSQNKLKLREFVNNFKVKENDVIISDINGKKKYIKFMLMILKVIKSIIDEYSNEVLNLDKGKIIMIIYYIFTYIRFIYFKDEQERFDLNTSGRVLSYIFDFIMKRKELNKEFFISKFEINTAKYSSFIFNEFNLGIKFDESKFEKYFEMNIKKEDNETIKSKEGQIDYICMIEKYKKLLNNIEYFKDNDNLNYDDIFDNFLINDLDENLNKKMLNKMPPPFLINNFENYLLTCFVQDIKIYEFLDLRLFLSLYIDYKEYDKFSNLSYYNIYHKINFIIEVNVEPNKTILSNINDSYSIQKQLYMKLLNLILISNKDKIKKFIDNIFATENSLNLFLINLQIITYYLYITLAYIEEKDFLIFIKTKYILHLSNIESFSLLELYNIIQIILKIKTELPSQFSIILKKFIRENIPINFFKENSIIYFSDKVPASLNKEFLLYFFEFINNLSGHFEYNDDRRQQILNYFISIINYKKGDLFKNIFIDVIFLIIFSIDDYINTAKNKKEKNIVCDDTKIIMLYRKYKTQYMKDIQNELLPDISKEFLKENNELKNIKIKLMFDIITGKVDKNLINNDFINCSYNYKGLLLLSTFGYDLLYTNKPNENNFSAKPNISFLNQKRIRMLSQSPSENKPFVSPFNKKNVFQNINNNIIDPSSIKSCQKNLNFQFDKKK